MTESWDRRGFLKRVGIACAGVAGASAIGFAAKDEGRDRPAPERRTGQVRRFDTGLDVDPHLVVVASGGPAEATRAALDALGGGTTATASAATTATLAVATTAAEATAATAATTRSRVSHCRLLGVDITVL